MISNEKKQIPERKSSGLTTEDIMKILQDGIVSAKDCISFETSNIRAMKAKFYELRRLNFPTYQHTFAKDKEKGGNFYNVWRIN